MNAEVVALKVQSLLDAMGKMPAGSREVVHALLQEEELFNICGNQDAQRLWSATSIQGDLRSLGVTKNHRHEAVRMLHTLLLDKEHLDSHGVEAESGSDSSVGGEIAAVQSSAILRVSQPSVSSSSPSDFPSQPGAESVLQGEEVGAVLLSRALKHGRQLNDTELGYLTAAQRSRYDRRVREQRQVLNSHKRHKKASGGTEPLPVTSPPTSLSGASPQPSQQPPPLSSTKVVKRTSWDTTRIPDLNLAPSSPHSVRQSGQSRSASKRKPTSSMDDDSHGDSRSTSGKKRGVKSSQKSSISPRVTDDCHSESSSSSSRSCSLSPLDPAFDDDPTSDVPSSRHHRSSRRHHSSRSRPSSRRHHHRRTSRRSRSPSPSSSSSSDSSVSSSERGVKEFLKTIGVASTKVLCAPDVTRQLCGQAPSTWWRNATTAFATMQYADTRTINEGLCLALCLDSADNPARVKELICRRLTGLHMVLKSGDKAAAWRSASALLPLDASSVVSLPVLQAIQQELRKSHKTTTSYETTRTYHRSYPHRGGGGSRGRAQNFNRSGYHSNAERSDGGGFSRRQSNRGHFNRPRSNNNQSGASSAPSHRGSSAGGSGATQQ